MAKGKDPKETAQEGKAAEPKKKVEGGGSGNKSFVMLFTAVIAVQLVIIIVLVYFYISRPPVPQMYYPQQIVETTTQQEPAKTEKKSSKKVVREEEDDDDDEDDEGGGSSKGPVIIYQTDPLIINPKGARAGKYLQTQVGIAVPSEEVKKEFEEDRKAQVYDILNGYLAAHSFEYLSDITKRDTLKMEIKRLLNKSIRGKKVRDVFFSKYVLQ